MLAARLNSAAYHICRALELFAIFHLRVAKVFGFLPHERKGR